MPPFPKFKVDVNLTKIDTEIGKVNKAIRIGVSGERARQLLKPKDIADTLMEYLRTIFPVSPEGSIRTRSTHLVTGFRVYQHTNLKQYVGNEELLEFSIQHNEVSNEKVRNLLHYLDKGTRAYTRTVPGASSLIKTTSNSRAGAVGDLIFFTPKDGKIHIPARAGVDFTGKLERRAKFLIKASIAKYANEVTAEFKRNTK